MKFNVQFEIKAYDHSGMVVGLELNAESIAKFNTNNQSLGYQLVKAYVTDDDSVTDTEGYPAFVCVKLLGDFDSSAQAENAVPPRELLFKIADMLVGDESLAFEESWYNADVEEAEAAVV